MSELDDKESVLTEIDDKLCLHVNNETPMVGMLDGKIDAFFYLDNGCIDSISFRAFIDAWSEGGKSVRAYLHFKPSQILDFLIESHEYEAGGPVGEESRLIFNQLRRELVDEIARIDGIKFEADSHTKKENA